MNVNSWLKQAKASISPLDAELILKHILNFGDRSDLVLHSDQPLTPIELTKANQLLTLRQNHFPLAYLLGYKDFYGRPFRVTPATLIPRPETEGIISLILSLTIPTGNPFTRFQGHCVGYDRAVAVEPHNDGRENRGLRKSSEWTILDIGTGSGCLAITLALELPSSKIIALDLSQNSLKIARQNAKNLGAKNLHFQQSNLLDNYTGAKPDIIVANLPYVDKTWDWLSPELRHEPSLALYADHHGLALIYRLLDKISVKWYNSNHDHSLILYLEAVPCQHPSIIRYAEKLHFHHTNTKQFILEFQLKST